MDLSTSALDDLAMVVEHHRDREERPLEVIDAYVRGRNVGTPATRQAYARAIEELSSRIASADVATRSTTAVECHWALTEEYVGRSTAAHVASLSEDRGLAHAVAYRKMLELYFDLQPYLTEGIPGRSRVLDAYPELHARFTPRDHLMPLGDGIEPGYAWVAYGQHDIHLHPGFRRGFTGGINSELLDLLWREWRRGLPVGIAVDHYRLCPRSELRASVELDRWFGRPLSVADLDDPRAVGATLHARVEALGVARDQQPGFLTEIRWSFQDGIKTVIIEELPDPTTAGQGPEPCRFVHATRDVREKRFIHLDGALAVYALDQYRVRYSQATNHHMDKVWAEQKVKLFRIDATETTPIADSDWTAIISTFFRGNELVLEYLSGKSYAEIYREEYGVDLPRFNRRHSA